MNNKLKALKRITGFSDDKLRYFKRPLSVLLKDDGGGGGGGSSNTVVFSVVSTEIFSPHNPTENISLGLISTVNGNNYPYTWESSDFIVVYQINYQLYIRCSQNITTEERTGYVKITQALIDGESKEITINVTQEAGPVILYDFITNPSYLNSGLNDKIILDYALSKISGVIPKPYSSSGNFYDAKILKDFNPFTIETDAFKANENLTNAEILSFMNIPLLPDNAFDGCSKLKTVVIPEICTKINNYAFKSCGTYEISYHVYTGLTVYFMSSTPPQVDDESTIFNYAILTAIYVPIGAGDAYRAAFPTYASYIQESAVKTAGAWMNNFAYKLNQETGYYEQVSDIRKGYNDMLEYINE